MRESDRVCSGAVGGSIPPHSQKSAKVGKAQSKGRYIVFNLNSIEL